MDGKIPRNSFGNIDIYVPSMIPPGAIHLPLKGTGKLARRLGIDYAEAVTGFEFKSISITPSYPLLDHPILTISQTKEQSHLSKE